MAKKKTRYKVEKKECIIKYISRNLDKQLKHLLNEKKKENPKDKEKMTYVWLSDNVEVKLRTKK